MIPNLIKRLVLRWKLANTRRQLQTSDGHVEFYSKARAVWGTESERLTYRILNLKSHLDRLETDEDYERRTGGLR